MDLENSDSINVSEVEKTENIRLLLGYLWDAHHAAVEVNRRFKSEAVYFISGSTAAFGFLGSAVFESVGNFGSNSVLFIALCFLVAAYILGAWMFFPFKATYPVGPKFIPNSQHHRENYISLPTKKALLNHIVNVCNSIESQHVRTEKLMPRFIWLIAFSIVPNFLVVIAYILSKFNF